MLPVMDLAYSLARNVLAAPVIHGMRWTVEGTHLIPPRGPVILASNHVSYLDPLMIGYVVDRRKRQARFLAKAELFDKEPLASMLRALGQIPVVRGDDRAADSLSAAVEALGRGECVVIFPEGTISLDLEPMVGKTGTARLAQESGVPVLPVGMWGAHRIMFKGRKPRWRWGVAETAVVGPPVRVAPTDDVREATDRIMAAVCRCVGRARELYPQRPASGEDWWYRPPETARLRSCRAAAGRPRPA